MPNTQHPTPNTKHRIPKGFVSLVGAGPGDPGLITVAGLQRLQEADVVVYDRLAGESLLQHARTDSERVYVGKEPGKPGYTQEAINQVLVDRGLQGKRVCRLKGGDPFVFGRGGEEAIACREAGLLFEVIPGVTSAIAAAAYAGIPVTHRKVAASFAVITGHEDPTRTSSGLDWQRLATAADTLVFLMGVENLEQITEELIGHGRSPYTPAALVEWGTLPRQRTLTATLGDLVRRAREEKIRSPAVTIVGDVVALRESIAWFDRRPLFGKKVLVTRSREQASDLVRLLEEQGAQVIEYPTIRIRQRPVSEIPQFLQVLEKPFDWVVFNSVNAVRCFFNLVREAGGDARSIGPAQVAAVGPITAEAIREAGLRVDFIPQEATSMQAAAAFPGELGGRRVLIPRALEAPDDMPRVLESRGASVTILPVYETVPDESAMGVRDAVLSGGVNIITFTSSSTARNFLNLVSAADVPKQIQIACIGPITAETVTAGGLRVDTIADEHTIPGLVNAIVQMVN